MEVEAFSFFQYNAEGRDIGDCVCIPKPYISTGPLSVFVNFEAVCNMNIMLKSDVLPRITIKKIIAKRFLEIPFFLFQFVMVKVTEYNRAKNYQYCEDNREATCHTSLENFSLFPKLRWCLRFPDIFLTFPKVCSVRCDVRAQGKWVSDTNDSRYAAKQWNIQSLIAELKNQGEECVGRLKGTLCQGSNCEVHEIIPKMASKCCPHFQFKGNRSNKS